MKAKFYAVVAELEAKDQWSLVGLYSPTLGHMAAISSKRSVVAKMFEMVAPEVKAKGAKIIVLAEGDDDGGDNNTM